MGRFLSVDPLTQEYPWYTPYQFAGNMPIGAIDLDGLEPRWFLDAMESEFPEITRAFDVLKGVKGNNFSKEKFYEWINGNSSYLDGKSKLKGMVGELIVFGQLKANFGSDAVLHSTKTTADITVTSKTGTDIWSFWQDTEVFMFRSHNLKGDFFDHRIADGRTVHVLNEVKTLDVNNSGHNRSNLARALIGGMDQVINQMNSLSVDPSEDLVIGVLWVDQEVIDKVMGPGPGVDHILVQKKFKEFTDAGGFIHLISGSKNASDFKDKNLNGKSETIITEVYQKLKGVVKEKKK